MNPKFEEWAKSLDTQCVNCNYKKPDYPIVVTLEVYKEFKIWLESFKKSHPEALIEFVNYRAPMSAVIDGKNYMFVSTCTAKMQLMGRTYYDQEGNLYHSMVLIKEAQKNERT